MNAPALEAATSATKRGWYLLPVQAGGKAPALGFKWKVDATSDTATVQKWLAQDLNFGVSCGPSGLLVVDEDKPGDFARWQSDQGVTLPDTFTVRTPSGGAHYYFQQGDLGIGNAGAFKKHGYGIDTRGAGGYVVGPGSVSAQGVLYEVELDAPVATLPDVLAQFLTEEPAPLPVLPLDTVPVSDLDRLLSPGDSKPGEMFDREHDTPEKLAAYLVGHGWQVHHRAGGEIHLTRPGKSTSAGTSATVKMANGRPGFYPFTTSTEFTAEHAYRPWHCYAVLEHDGDYQTAAKALRKRYSAVYDFAPVGLPDGTGSVTEADTDTMPPSWEPVDLGPLLDMIETGIDTTPRPTIGRIAGAGHLFYASAINGIYGDAGTGKTFTANAVTCQELEAGHDVLHIDWEAGPTAIINRLLTAGIKADTLREHFHYVQPDTPFSLGGKHLIDYARKLKPSLVVIDSTGEAVANEGANPNADEEIAQWFQMLPAPLARTGAAVLVLDHAAKSEDSARKGPVGSHRKLAAITGVQYEQRAGSPFSKVQDGYANLVVKKDRHGTYTKGQTVAQLKVAGAASHLEIVSPAEVFRPTDTMGRIMRNLEMSGGSIEGFNTVKELVGGKHAVIQTALGILAQEGYIRQDTGARKKVTYTKLRAYEPGGLEGDFLLPDNTDTALDSTDSPP